MNKKIILVVLIVILFVILTKIVIDLNSPGSSVQIAAGKNGNNITYKIHTKYNQGNFDYSKRGYYVDSYYEPNAPWLYIITMGEQTTGGYSIDISNVKIDKNKNVEVIIKENIPQNGETVTMALTYPAVCIEFSKKPNSIKIINTEGEIFEELNGNKNF